MTILILPDDLILNCLARVSRLYHPTLSLVSKRIRSLLASTELYQTRTLLPRTESCLYVCLRLCPTNSNPLCWFTLGRRPHSSKKMILVPISSPDVPSTEWSEMAVVGPNIYAIHGTDNPRDNNVATASSSVMMMVMDCRSHKWREAPSMRLPHMFHSVCVLDGKIYVTGGCENLDQTNWMEVFDTNSQTWEFMQNPSKEICGGSEYINVRHEGTIYVRSKVKNVTYKLNKGRWRVADLAMNSGWLYCRSQHYCVIENVFYRYDGSKIDWYESKEKRWITIKGLEILARGRVKFTDYGGRMAVLWEEYVWEKNVSIKETKIWCAEIAIEKRQKGEIWGIVEWCDVVYTTNDRFRVEHALSATI